jgi:hypothetical protein
MTALSPRPGVDLLFVPVPEGILSGEVNGSKLSCLRRNGTVMCYRNLPPGQWEYLFLTGKEKESDVEGLVMHPDYNGGFSGTTWVHVWNDYIRENNITGLQAVLRKVDYPHNGCGFAGGI